MRTLVLFATLLALGCGGTGHSGVRNAAGDSHCDGRTPRAYDFDKPKDAYAAGCVDVRIHKSRKNPETGETEHFEDVVFCCPK